jgi:molybdenum cofactor cytidylyltransferase
MNAAVVLAAGLSSRFPGNKLLCTIGGKTLLRHTVERVLACSEIDSCTVVARKPDRAILEAVEGLAVELTLVDGPAAHSESLKAGLSSLPSRVRRIMVALGDQPASTDLLSRIMREAIRSERDVLVPTYLGKRGNPVVFRSEFVPKLYGLSGDSGARSMLEQWPDAVHELELGGVMPPDLDSDADLRAVARYLRTS